VIAERKRWRRIRRHVSLVDSLDRFADDVGQFDELAGDERDVVEGARVALRALALNGSRLPTLEELAHAKHSLSLALERARATTSPTVHHFGELVAHAHELVLRNIANDEAARAGRGPQGDTRQ
jgi:hypothetical protein